jgi:hypothetical protein
VGAGVTYFGRLTGITDPKPELKVVSVGEAPTWKWDAQRRTLSWVSVSANIDGFGLISDHAR